MGRLLDRAKEGEKVWRPTRPGEALEGIVVKIRQVHFGSVLVVRGFAYDAEGNARHDQEASWLVNVGRDSTLAAKIAEAGTVEGCGIAIVFKGTGKSKAGRDFNVWSVAVEKPEPTSGGGLNGKDQLADDTNPF